MGFLAEPASASSRRRRGGQRRSAAAAGACSRRPRRRCASCACRFRGDGATATRTWARRSPGRSGAEPAGAAETTAEASTNVSTLLKRSGERRGARDRLWAHATRRRPDAVKEENRFAFQTAALIFEAAAEELGETRAVLNDAVAGLDGDGGDGAVGPTAALGVRGAAASAVARNEIRYWDSKRDWGSPESLQLLLDSSQLAVLYLEDAVPRRPRDLARARVSVANGCFKAGCVCDPRGDRAFAYFRDAHASLARVPEALAGEPGGRVAAEALLVGRFYEAEFQLRGAVGETSEPSIYTFGNLSEAYLHVLHELPLGILHERKGCDVAVKALGADHPNAARKLAEFADVLAQIGMPDLAGAGAPCRRPRSSSAASAGRPGTTSCRRSRGRGASRCAARSRLHPWSFWDAGVPPAMVELAVDDHSDDDDVPGLPLTEPLDDDDDGDDGVEGPAVAGTTAVGAPPAPADLSPTVEMHAVASGLLMYNPDAPGHS
ncbi:hypothetical protein JL720_13607 [Aureococcus anophagefferens]|nr:hypothetical protein JL720_13607 [Aureococcus anophagefferens]